MNEMKVVLRWRQVCRCVRSFMISDIRSSCSSNAVSCNLRWALSKNLMPSLAPLTAGKMLFFGSRCEQLCMMQFSLISLIPGLLRNLQDCADPELDSYHQGLVRPTSLRTSDRGSCKLIYASDIHTAIIAFQAQTDTRLSAIVHGTTVAALWQGRLADPIAETNS